MKPSALALEAIMSGLSRADVEALRRLIPSHLLDQSDAATADIEKVAQLIAALAGSTSSELPFRAIPEWLRLSIADTLLRYHSGTNDTCMHNPRPANPQPIVAAAWKPGLVTDVACVRLFRVSAEKDHTCDRCGGVFDVLHACSLSYGPLIYNFGLCADCMTDQEAAQRPPPSRPPRRQAARPRRGARR